jgi:hypothetical protein
MKLTRWQIAFLVFLGIFGLQIGFLLGTWMFH